MDFQQRVIKVKCNRCGKREALRIQKIHDVCFEKKIAFCDFCLRETLSFDSEDVSSFHVRNLVEKSFIFEDRVSKNDLSIDDNIILIFLLPQLISQNMFIFDTFAQKRMKKSIIEIQINYFESKVELAKSKEEYKNALRFEKISRGLKKYLRKKETN